MDNLQFWGGTGSSRLLMVGGGKVHGGALEGTLEGKTMPDLGQRAGCKPQSNEKVFVRSRAEGACC